MENKPFDDYQTLLGIKDFSSRLTGAAKCLKMPQFGAHAGHIKQIHRGTYEKHENDTEKVIFGLKIIPFFIPSDYMASSILRQKHSPELNVYLTKCKNTKRLVVNQKRGL